MSDRVYSLELFAPITMSNKKVGAIFQKRELKILMTGENEAIDHVISIVLQKCIQGLKYSVRLKVPEIKAKTRLGTCC